MASTFTLLKSSLLLLSTLAVSEAAATGHGRLHEARNLQKRAAISTNLPAGWASQGCFTDNVNSRALGGKFYFDAAMTEESCISYCSSNGFAYAGVEYSQECYCGNTISASGKTADAGDCNMGCAGNANELCGAGNRLNIFHNENQPVTAAAPPALAHNAGPAGWGYLGCYTDSTAARTLAFNTYSEGGAASLTVALCTEACQAGGYNISGVEYSGECWCANAFTNGGGPAPDGLAGCNMPCNGNATEACGGPNRLDVYGFGKKSSITPQWTSLGCYSDSVQTRTLKQGMPVIGGAANMTQENCQDACAAGSYTLAGVEYAQECYCGNAIQAPGGPAPDGDAQCNMACNGNANEVCGGPNRLNIFSYNGGPVATSTPTSPTDPGNPTSTPTTPPVAPALPTSWTYRGCWVDNKYGRILEQQPGNDPITIESCVAQCISIGMDVAGMEYSAQCFCGDSIINGGALSASDSDCAMTCSGNSTEICGGPNLMSVYASGNLTTYKVPTARTINLPGSWTYEGCLTDIPARVLPYQTDMQTNVTIASCLDLCATYGYDAGGVEYGMQCFCGDDTDRVNSGAPYRAEADCNQACADSPEDLCGGGNAINYYTRPVTNTWHQGVGNNAGQYQFLIGGVVIPLLTTVGVNNKVTFVEKHGTGPPNSTGAYELDLSEINNFDQAWRTMNGLKTDVFCSAGLTLPDKAGRQINIGGWSADSLYGVRFYTPDGSPGVAGVNDWEENVNEVALQIGRWYPTAMTMVNGSILVVGGEDGSNGPPVPNLEVLPKPAGGYLLYCDWLERTDPYNLYPFLAILPSGGIFVAYYNEALILDEVTLTPKKTLPQIPGAVNNAAGGRTYPLEGTSMLMPQVYPYTDPLKVLICGGSTPFGGHALDNCVSITPEVAGAQWEIERMPSRRVMSCMTALPDGTYLILNGAMQGEAGFGLADLPNHNALLYDPNAAVGSRFTRLANTTIDRLYHSEAILLPDGRVLVSGSDPEDDDHLQEYRVEVFIPPYLMGELPATRPEFTIANNNTDWDFSETITLHLTAGSASRAALMGAVSSTHGNSMGQRSIFPSFSCSGTTCTLITPPNGHVTGGPGWFMLFVLNAAGVPSHSQWVRIGGDPAGLGNWPNFPDFSLPGI